MGTCFFIAVNTATIDPNKIPQHIAIIMDGNGRWAKKQGRLRVLGHDAGVLAVRKVVEKAAEVGVKHLTLYTFSTENWNRPQFEVNALMQLMVRTIHKETSTLMKNGIRLNAIGDLSSLPQVCIRELTEAKAKTADNTRMTLHLALSYSSKWEITSAMRSLAKDVKSGKLMPDDINENLIAAHLCTAGIPDPELLIRTSGEYRISNFLLWQLAYSELYFTDKLWPDFDGSDLVAAIADYQRRERRFGLTSEQLQPAK